MYNGKKCVIVSCGEPHWTAVGFAHFHTSYSPYATFGDFWLEKNPSFFIFYEEQRKKELHKDCKECNNSKHFRVNALGRFFNAPAEKLSLFEQSNAKELASVAVLSAGQMVSQSQFFHGFYLLT